MYKKIMVPVDLAHQHILSGSLKIASDIAKLYDAEVCYVGATTAAPSAVAHTPAEFESKLQDFAAEQAALYGINTVAYMALSHDPVTNLDHDLIKAVSETNADLVVMATHSPNIGDFIWPSNGGKLAAHTDVSVFLVRENTDA